MTDPHDLLNDRITTLARVLDPNNEGEWGHMDVKSQETVRTLLAERAIMLPIYRDHVTSVARVAEQRETERRRVASLTEHELHCEQRHPDYEYATMEYARKSGEDLVPQGEGWEPNDIVIITNGLHGPDDPPKYRAWERGLVTEINYWRRRKFAKEQP